MTEANSYVDSFYQKDPASGVSGLQKLISDSGSPWATNEAGKLIKSYKMLSRDSMKKTGFFNMTSTDKELSAVKDRVKGTLFQYWKAKGLDAEAEFAKLEKDSIESPIDKATAKGKPSGTNVEGRIKSLGNRISDMESKGKTGTKAYEDQVNKLKALIAKYKD